MKNKTKAVSGQIQTVDINSVKSKWYSDIFDEWQPDRKFIDYLKKCIKSGEYLAPIVVVQEEETYYIVNGHHRFYAHAEAGESTIRCIVLEGDFESTAPLRKAEVLLKEYDQETSHRYQFSGYLDRWAAAAEKHNFINKYQPKYSLTLRILRKIKNILKK